jgi:hypothetical protein
MLMARSGLNGVAFKLFAGLQFLVAHGSPPWDLFKS